MECKEFEKQISDFIKRKLDYVTLKEFMRHIKECPKCEEELTIQFLIEEGLVRLEEGSAFDLQHELRTWIIDAKRQIRRHDLTITIGTVIEYMVMFGVLVVIAMIIFS